MKSSISASIPSSRMAWAAWSMSITMAAGSGRRRRLLRPDAGTSHVAGQWRKLIPSAELVVDPGRGARCAVRDTGAPGPGRYHWTVEAARLTFAPMATRLAGFHVGAFWDPDDPTLISLPGPAWLDAD
jgi:hypothetical protein